MRGGHAVELAAAAGASQTSPPPTLDVIDANVRVPAVAQDSVSRVGLVNRLRTTTTFPIVLDFSPDRFADIALLIFTEETGRVLRRDGFFSDGLICLFQFRGDAVGVNS